MSKLFALILFLFAIPTLAQNTPKRVALTDKSNVSTQDISKSFQKECPTVTVTNDVSKSDYGLEAVKTVNGKGPGQDSIDFTLFDTDGRLVSTISTLSLGGAAKDLCRAIKTAILIEVVDSQNLTQSVDRPGDTSGGVAGTIINGVTGRRTSTDNAMIYVVANGEHATLDCYERAKGCTTIGPGKYYGELDGDSIWVNYEMPLTHKPIRNHYRLAGSW